MKTTFSNALLYIDAYERKDLATIAKLISDDVELVDWNVGGKGRKFFLDQTQKNFESQEVIEIDVLQVFERKQIVALQLRITVDSVKTLEVIDLLSFDSSGKIMKVQAYKSL